MEKISCDIVFNLKNNPSGVLKEINKLLIDIQSNTMSMSTAMSQQIIKMQNPVDDARQKWLGLAGDAAAYFAVFSENASGAAFLLDIYDELDKIGAITRMTSIAQLAYNSAISLGQRALYVYQMQVLTAHSAISTTTGATWLSPPVLGF